MARTPKMSTHNHNQDDDYDDAEDVAAGTDTSSHREGKGAEQKPRSKHSETEQRRRCKINERFQILKDLIPPNEQKRDKASLLLEVIEYIQFLQEKLQLYEGPYQPLWNQEPAKMAPWRLNHGSVDNFASHPETVRNGSMNEHNAALPMANVQGSVDPVFSGEMPYVGPDPHVGSMPPAPLNIPLQPFSHLPGRVVLPAENVSPQRHGTSTVDCAIRGNESTTFDGGSSSASSFYSQGLLKKLTEALQTSGVDLSQANISVQLDVSKRDSNGVTAGASTAMDVGNNFSCSQSGPYSGELSEKEFVQAAKRPRIGES